MTLCLLESSFSLPLTDPVLIFSVVLFIIFFIPMLLNRIRIPGIIGMIIIGALIGPHGFNILLRDSSIQLFGKVGLLYIMFLAALEIDLEDFKQNRIKSGIFALYTFAIPMLIALPVVFYVLGYPILSTILIASIFSSHTLISYPLVGKYEITKNKAVNITVGGTMLTDIAALLALAVIVQLASGSMHASFWIKLSVSLVVFVLIVWQVIPRIARFFFKKEEDHIQQYIFTLGIVFLCAFLAEATGMEAIIGAFLGGLALNKFIPKTSALMNRIEFIGNALFIPFFMIGVGMLIDFRIFLENSRTIIVAGVITVLAIGTKYLAAFLSGKTFSFSEPETRLMFGLSSAQAAATLAVVTVGYNVFIAPSGNGTPQRLLDDAILNGSILMILVTCTISSLVVNRNARRIAQKAVVSKTKRGEKEVKESILISLSDPGMISEMMELALLIRQSKDKENVFALNVITDDNVSDKKLEEGKKLMEKAAKEAAGSDLEIEPIVRYDYSVPVGVIHTLREKEITDLLIGLDEDQEYGRSGLPVFVNEIVYKTNESVLIYRPVQPLGTIKNLVVWVPDQAYKESGFDDWYRQIGNLCKQTGAKITFYASETMLKHLKEKNPKPSDDEKKPDERTETGPPLPVSYETLDFPFQIKTLRRQLKADDLWIVIGARKSTTSYQPGFEGLYKQLSRVRNGYLIVYPDQETYDPITYFDLFSPSHEKRKTYRMKRRLFPFTKG